jgi:hypothetical protein
MRDYRGLRREIGRLKRQLAGAAAGEAGDPVSRAFYAFLADPTPAAQQALDALLAKEDPLGHRCRAAWMDPIELKIEALLACHPSAPAEVIEAKMWEILNGPAPRPRCGLVELGPEGEHNTRSQPTAE